MNDKWRQRESWVRRGEDFCVEVVHWKTDPVPESLQKYFYRGPHRWNVYAYIWKNHRLFDRAIDKTSYALVPLHGESFHERQYNDDGEIVSVKIGGDYDHFGDERFSYYSTAEEARTVFRDADELFDFLSSDKTEHDGGVDDETT